MALLRALAIAWPGAGSPSPSPWWIPVASAVVALLFCAWVARLAERHVREQARRDAENVVAFPRR